MTVVLLTNRNTMHYCIKDSYIGDFFIIPLRIIVRLE